MIGYDIRIDEAKMQDAKLQNKLKKEGYVLSDWRTAREAYSLPSAFRVYTEHFRALSSEAENEATAKPRKRSARTT